MATNTAASTSNARAAEPKNADRKSVGQKLDEVLEPFVKDRQRLLSQMREQKELRAQVEQQIKDIQRDLDVIEQAMIDAVRDAAKNDPLLSAAFQLAGDGDGNGAKLPDLNPLLKPSV